MQQNDLKLSKFIPNNCIGFNAIIVNKKEKDDIQNGFSQVKKNSNEVLRRFCFKNTFKASAKKE